MALLSDTVRTQIWRGLQRYWSRELVVLGIMDKTDLRDAINACDDWIDANQASFNAALPATFQSQATATQKTFLFCVVALARVSVPLLKQILGEVD